MTRRLLLLRHAKSAWDTGTPSDFERPLAPRGRRDAPRMGRWLASHPELLPDHIIASPAERARETILAVAEAAGLDPGRIVWDQRVYGASAGELTVVVQAAPADAGTVMLVGHNPGLDLLLRALCPRAVVPPSGKLMPTAALASIRLDGCFADLEPATGILEEIIRPRDV